MRCRQCHRPRSRGGLQALQAQGGPGPTRPCVQVSRLVLRPESPPRNTCPAVGDLLPSTSASSSRAAGLLWPEKRCHRYGSPESWGVWDQDLGLSATPTLALPASCVPLLRGPSRCRPGTPHPNTVLATPPIRTSLLKTKEPPSPDAPFTRGETLGSAALAWVRGDLEEASAPSRCQMCKGNAPAGKTRGSWNPGGAPHGQG